MAEKLSVFTAATGLPFKEAIAFLAQKTNLTSTGWTDVWGKANARGFTVAGAASEALVADFREAVQKAIEEGTTLEDFRKRFDEIVLKHGWKHRGSPGWRARIIYNTNLSMAYAAGRYQQHTEPLTLKLFPYWQYVHSGAKHPRRDHLAWNGMVLAADDPFWEKGYPPNGWNCGCWVRILSKGNLKRLGRDKPDAAPELKEIAWTDRKTGEIKPATLGIDPGFDYNVGKEWEKIRAERVTQPLPVPAIPMTPDKSEVAARLVKHYASWVSSLSVVEVGAVGKYKSPDGFIINQELRGITNTSNYGSVAEDLDRALNRAVLDQPTRLWRSLQPEPWVNALKVGDVVPDTGFASFTLDAVEAARRFIETVVIDITAPAGQRGALLGAIPRLANDLTGKPEAEWEFLFPRGLKLRILKREGNRIEAEIVNDR